MIQQREKFVKHLPQYLDKIFFLYHYILWFIRIMSIFACETKDAKSYTAKTENFPRKNEKRRSAAENERKPSWVLNLRN